MSPVGNLTRCLRKVLGNAQLTLCLHEMSKVLVEVENTINSRPLTKNQDEELDWQVLTPSHLLFGRRLSPLSENGNSELDIEEASNKGIISKRILNLTKRPTHFWKR